MSSNESVNLFYTEGSSNKVYQAQLEEREGGWVVNFQFGPRGGTLKAGTKTAQPLDYALAKKEYDKLVKSKMAKGYTPDVSGSVFQDTQAGEEFTAIVPQLLNELRDEAEIEQMVCDDAFWMQEKHDGQRRMVKKAEDIMGINRRGMRVPLPMPMVKDIEALNASRCLLDGEIIGEKLYVFDLLELDGNDLRALPFEKRLLQLDKLLAHNPTYLRFVPVATNAATKRAMIEDVRARKGEGVVFKRSNAPYVAGRPASGGNQRKFKFTEMATVQVMGHHKSKRSIEVGTLEGSKKVKLGNCSVPTNHGLPPVGALVEVEYLYLYEGGSLFQPQYRGVRDDKDAPDALVLFKTKPKNCESEEEMLEAA